MWVKIGHNVCDLAFILDLPEVTPACSSSGTPDSVSQVSGNFNVFRNLDGSFPVLRPRRAEVAGPNLGQNVIQVVMF